jgi:hypothetical protein
MMPINATTAVFKPIDLFSKPALLTTKPIDRSTVPEGLFAYDVQHCDKGGVFATIEKSIVDNCAGTVITSEALDFGEGERIPLNIERGGLNIFPVHECTAVDELLEYARREDVRRLPDNGILTADACIEGSKQDSYAGRVVILNPDILRPQYRFASDQLIFAKHGFGCSPTARGKLVIGKNLYDGTTERHGREDFMGIADPCKLPQWAREALYSLSLSVKARHDPTKDRSKNPPSR